MTDSEKLDLLLAEMLGMKGEMHSMKDDVQSLKDEMHSVKDDIMNLKGEMHSMKDDIMGMKDEMHSMKDDIQSMKDDIQLLKKKVTDIELHLENYTDRNIQLIAENFIELTNKLNQAIPAADHNRMYEVKVNYLMEEVRKLAEEVSKIKEKTA